MWTDLDDLGMDTLGWGGPGGHGDGVHWRHARIALG
jgi:hypothetical protein